MEKVIRFNKTKTIYYCDICKKEQVPYREDDELLVKCDICGKDVCVECRDEIPTVNCNVPEFTLCKDCLRTNSDTIERINSNIANFNQIDGELRKLLK
jgi:hypothetical protein